MIKLRGSDIVCHKSTRQGGAFFYGFDVDGRHGIVLGMSMKHQLRGWKYTRCGPCMIMTAVGKMVKLVAGKVRGFSRQSEPAH